MSTNHYHYKSHSYHTFFFPKGDLFEREDDVEDPSLWKYVAGSENMESQEKHRNEVLLMADYIVPGHGPMFKVTQAMKDVVKKSSENR